MADLQIKTAVCEAKEKIAALRKEDSLVIPVFTDLHTSGIDGEYTERLVSLLEILTSEIPCDALVDLGDNTGMLGRNEHITNGDLEKLLKGLFDKIYNAAKLPMLFVNGNHDGIGTDFFNAPFWNGIVKKKYGNTSAVYDEDGSYYYVDLEKADTRIIVLSVPSDADLIAENPTPVWKLGERQINWLENVALKTEKYVVILSHVPFYDVYRGENQLHSVWDGEKERFSTTYALCGSIEDADRAALVINAFNEKNKGKLIACLSGHTHSDSLYNPCETKGENINPLSCHQIVTTAACLRQEGISMDIAVWTPSQRRFDMIRIGEGEDRSIIVGE